MATNAKPASGLLLLTDMRDLIGAILLMAAAGHLSADDVVRGRLCLREPGQVAVVDRCSQFEGTRFDVEPAPEDRVWIWSGTDMRTIAVGVIGSEETEIRLPEEPLAANLEVTGSADREWPQSTLLAIGRADQPLIWKIELSPMQVGRLREIVLPRGAWSLGLRADRHAIWSHPPVRLADEPVDLGLIELDPLPQIHGTMIDGEGELLSSVLLIAADGTPLATSDSEGKLLWESSCGEDPESCLLPEWFRLEYPGTAPHWFRAIRRDRDLDLDVVRMAPGGTLEVSIDRQEISGRLMLEIIEDSKPVPPLERYPVVVGVELSGDENTALFENLPEGMLRLDIRGDSTGKQYSEYLVIRAGETLEREVVLEPRTFEFKVVDDGERMSGVPVKVEQLEPPFRVSQTMPTDSEGLTSITLWQPGDHKATLAHTRLRGGIGLPPAAIEEPLMIEVGSAGVSGRVVDDDTGKPVVGAMVQASHYRFYSDDEAPGALTDSQGRYEIGGLMDGWHSVGATADHYSEGGKGIDVKAGVNAVETIRLKSLVPYTITASWEDGMPVVGAALYFGGDEAADLERVTDENGRITVELVPPPRPVRVWIVPKEGSFADLEIYLDQRVDVIMPTPAGPVELDLVDEDDRPIDFAQVYFSYGNMALEYGLRETLELMQGLKFHSGPAPRLVLDGLAPGTYELTAIHTFSESDVPRHLYGLRPTMIHAGPVEQSGKVKVGRLELVCRGPHCEYRVERPKRDAQ